MFTATIRTAILSAVLCLGTADQIVRADVFTLDLPELTGTFVHGQAPILAYFAFGGDFQSVGDMTLSIIATGLPGLDGGGAGVPAELLASVLGYSMEQLEPTVFGPYGLAPMTMDATFAYSRGLSGDLAGTFSVTGDVIIDTHDIYPGITDAPVVSILSVTLTVEGTLCDGSNGDIGCDGFVGIAELNVVLGNWNQNVTPGDFLSGDITGDGFVGIEDLNQVLGNWNAGTPPGGAVPEPASLAWLGVGLLSTIRGGRR